MSRPTTTTTKKTTTTTMMMRAACAAAAAAAAAGALLVGAMTVALIPPRRADAQAAAPAPAPAAAPADVGALINKALDEQVKLNLDTTVPQALAAITQQTGVRLREDPAIYDLLPWGRDTAVKARIENKTLREALEVITRKLGLTMALREQYVEIAPMPALRRLAQRASPQELEALGLLSTRPLGLEAGRHAVSAILEAVDKRLAEEKGAELALENRIADAVPQDKAVYVPRNATLMDALDALAKETRATWYPWGRTVLVVTKEEVTRRMLGKPLTLRPGSAGMDVMAVLAEASARTGVFFEYQPGMLTAIPAEARQIRGIFENATALQVLEAVSAATGLKYVVNDEKVSFAGTAAAPAGAPQREPMIGFIQLGNGLSVMVPASQVPDDLRQYIRHKVQRELDEMRMKMLQEGFVPKPPEPPATRPATPDDGPKDL